MKNKKKVLILIIGAIFYTIILLNQNQDPSLTLILNGAYAGDDYLGIVLWCFWFTCVSFYFLGTIEDYFEGFGLYELVRNGKRHEVLLKRYLSVGVQLFIIILLQMLIVGLLSVIFKGEIGEIEYKQFIISFIMYYMTIYELILIQLLFEMYMKSQIAMLVLNIYVVISISLAGVLFECKKANMILYILVPNFAMAQRTSILNKDIYTILWGSALAMVIFMIIGVGMLSIEGIKSKDII